MTFINRTQIWARQTDYFFKFKLAGCQALEILTDFSDRMLFSQKNEQSVCQTGYRSVDRLYDRLGCRAQTQIYLTLTGKVTNL